jgi:hypothetical protein
MQASKLEQREKSQEKSGWHKAFLGAILKCMLRVDQAWAFEGHQEVGH